MRWRCGDCKGSLSKLRLAPMVHDEIWRAAACDPHRRLCDACFRSRMARMLGRGLRFEDLTCCRWNIGTGHLHELAPAGWLPTRTAAVVVSLLHNCEEVPLLPGDCDRVERWLLDRWEAAQACW
jgi:hypothetical protein